MQKIILETGADAVKLEGGEKISSTINYLTKKEFWLLDILECYLSHVMENIKYMEKVIIKKNK